MALHSLRGGYCCRLPSLFSVTQRRLTPEHVVQTRPSKTQVLSLGAVSLARSYCSDAPKANRTFVMAVQNPFRWLRSRFYFFLIRAYIDKDFTVAEFTEGAKQAFFHVSQLVSTCQYGAMEGLVTQGVVGKLKEVYSHLPANQKQVLLASPDDIMVAIPSNVGFFEDANRRPIVVILMQFWYLPRDQPIDHLPITPILAHDSKGQTRQLLSAKYQFQTEFRKGADPDWIITSIAYSIWPPEHSDASF